MVMMIQRLHMGERILGHFILTDTLFFVSFESDYAFTQESSNASGFGLLQIFPRKYGNNDAFFPKEYSRA